MTARYASRDEIAIWDELITSNPDGGNVFQSIAMSEVKQKNGWSPVFLVVDKVAILVIEKKIPFLGKFWYLPKAPGVSSTEELAEVIVSLKQFTKKTGVFLLTIEPELVEDPDTNQEVLQLGLKKVAPIQPNQSTVLIDTSPTEHKILQNLNQKSRHAINRAIRDGVTVEPVDLSRQNVDIMLNLLSETASGRFENSLKDPEYYENFWKTYSDRGDGQLFFAYYQGEVVSSAYVLSMGAKALYKDGASVRDRTVYGASHLLQWEIIKWLKNKKVISYDLCGSPHSSRINDTSHPLYGVGRFKTSFNKHVTDYIGCFELVVRPVSSLLWRWFVKRLVVSLTWRIKHQQWL